MKHVKVSFDPLKRMDAAARRIVEIQKGYGVRADELRKYYRGQGTFGCSAMTARLQELQQEANSKCAPFLFAIDDEYRAYITALDDALLPDGSKIHGGDAALIEHRLIQTPSELQALGRRHADNPVMLRMINDYARQRGWDPAPVPQYDNHFLREFGEERHALARTVADGYRGQEAHYGAAYFEKHTDVEQDYKDWAAENADISFN